MAENTMKKSNRFTGTMKYLDKQNIGYIVPDIEVFVQPPSLSSNTIKEGDRVEFRIKFRDSHPQFEAIDVTPIKLQCSNCLKFGHSTTDCRRKSSKSKSRVRCYRCGKLGHFARDCSGRSSSSCSTSSSSSSVVCVKKKEDVKKVEEVEDCFILEFDVARNDDEFTTMKSVKKDEFTTTKSVKKDVDDDDDGDDDDEEELRSIVCVKNVEDVKKVEEVEDCFILEFDPDDEAVKLSELSLCDDDDDDSDDVSVVAAKGKVACRDYPHPRNLCATYPFNTTPHEIHCKMCYCFVCDKPAPCETWTKGSINPYFKHCDATNDVPIWKKNKEVDVI